MTNNPKVTVLERRRELKRRWIEAHPEANHTYNMHRRKKRKLYGQKYKKANTTKIKARKLVQWNLICGKLKKKSCIECGSSKSQAHHDDYSKPLEVIWVCQRHHWMFHRALPLTEEKL